MNKLAVILLAVIVLAMLADAAYPSKDKVRMKKAKAKAMTDKKAAAKMDKQKKMEALEARKRADAMGRGVPSGKSELLELREKVASGEISDAEYKQQARMLKDNMKRQGTLHRAAPGKDKAINKRDAKEALKRRRAAIKNKRARKVMPAL